MEHGAATSLEIQESGDHGVGEHLGVGKARAAILIGELHAVNGAAENRFQIRSPRIAWCRDEAGEESANESALVRAGRINVANIALFIEISTGAEQAQQGIVMAIENRNHVLFAHSYSFALGT